jgi:coatomer subunit delta
MVANRDGGLQNLEVKGEMMLLVSESDKGCIRLQLAYAADSPFQFKVRVTAR